MLHKNVIPFLTDLSNNNNKDWFTANKSRYQEAHKDFTDFIDQLIAKIAETDPLLQGTTAKDCVFRIYRDVRFSKDKTPYKTHFGAHIAVGGRKSKRAGFYLHIDPSGNSFTGGGIHMPEAPILKAIRNEFFQVPEELIEILNNQEYKKYHNGLWEENKLKTAPKGFPKDFEHIDLLRYKSYIAIHNLKINDISAADFISKLIHIHKAMYPLNRLLNTIIEDAGL
ncbi:MAG: DUF2461 domain-containing protein [Salinivirgaceae bacterium]|nr:DUF2461 domain-containing protein [Salinivirgaceae bacterium]